MAMVTNRKMKIAAKVIPAWPKEPIGIVPFQAKEPALAAPPV